MEESKPLPFSIRFGIFEVDCQGGGLRRKGFKVKLQEQPFQVLLMLVDRPGEVVTREELQKNLWAADTFVDFERGLNRAINKLREALGDDAENPRFIETLPRRGYRFLAAVEAAGRPEKAETANSPIAIVPADRRRETKETVAAVATRRVVQAWIVGGTLALVALVVSWRAWPRAAKVAEQPFLQLDVNAGPDEFSQPAISLDGSRMVFVSKQGLTIRRLDQSQAIRLAGTQGAAYPFLSPDGRWVAFFAANKLKKVAVEGGAVVVLCDAPSGGGGSWAADNQIVASLDARRGLDRVSAAGGTPRPLTDPREDPSGILMHRWPQVLPGGKGVLFAATNASGAGSLRVLGPRDSRPRTVVLNATYGRILTSGYLVFHRSGALFAAPIDLDRLELTGAPVPVVDGVFDDGGRADFDLSATGTLLYRHGAAPVSTVSWLYSSGRSEAALAKAANYSTPRLSPDGRRLAISVILEGQQSLWVYDLSRETRQRLTSGDETELLPTWTADGEFLAFRSGDSLAWTRSDGSGKVDHLEGVSRNSGPWSFSPDGKWLAFWPLQPSMSDLWVAPVERAPGSMRLGRSQLLLDAAGSKGAPAISPDGRWLAYASYESGHFEVYVAPFSPQRTVSSSKWAVSNGGGHSPIWSPKGRELFYEGPGHRIHVASYQVVGDSFVPEKPRLWSEQPMSDIGFFPAFDAGRDGSRVLALMPAEHPKPETIVHVLVNLDTELRKTALSHRK